MEFQAVKANAKVLTKGFVEILYIECPNCRTRYRILAPSGAEDTVRSKAQTIREHITAKCSTEHADVINFSA